MHASFISLFASPKDISKSQNNKQEKRLSCDFHRDYIFINFVLLMIYVLFSYWKKLLMFKFISPWIFVVYKTNLKFFTLK